MYYVNVHIGNNWILKASIIWNLPKFTLAVDHYRGNIDSDFTWKYFFENRKTSSHIWLSICQWCATNPPLSNFVHPLAIFVTLFLCLIYCVILHNGIDIIDLYLLSLGTFIPAALCCEFYVARNQIYWKLEMGDIVFASALIWHQTHRQTHTGHPGTQILFVKHKQY